MGKKIQSSNYLVKPYVIIQVLFFLIAVTLANKTYADNSFQGSISPIPDYLQKEMIGNTWHQGCPVALKDLSYLKLSYWGFDNKPHVGDMIINHLLAPEVLDIFKQLYAAHYPIEKMVVPEELIGNKKFASSLALAVYLDNTDDTNAFSCRIDGQNPTNFSPHSYGIAIDINPFYNPGVIAPQYISFVQGYMYLNRNLQHIGMIREDDIAVKTFLDHGWLWHGFSEQLDYMHFGKMITTHYVINHIEYLPPDKRITNLND